MQQHTLIINQIDSMWHAHKQTQEGGIKGFISRIHDWAIDNCVDNVIVTRGERILVDDLHVLLEEFEFTAHVYGDYNYKELVEEGHKTIPHPIDDDKVIQIDSWMQELEDHKVSMYGLEDDPASYELRVGLRDAVGCALEEIPVLQCQ